MPRVFLVGSSQLKYSETGNGPTIASLTVDALRRLSGEDWAGEAELAYPLPGMTARVQDFVTGNNPDAVVLFLGSSVFAEEKMEYALNKKSKFLYGLLRPLVGNLKKVGGGGTEGAPGIRGLVFRAPRAVGRMLIGTAPLVEPDVAWDQVRQTISFLATRGPLLVIKSTGAPHDAATRARSEARKAEFNRRVEEYCDELGVRCLDVNEELGRLGRTFVYAADGGHPAQETRLLTADVLATELLAVLAGSPSGRLSPAS
jgi:hypothetical protein